MSQLQESLPIPEHCDNCCSINIELTTNDKIYGTLFGKWPKIYYCNDCKAAVGCHPGTIQPLGRMADRITRQLRKKAHDEFDNLWRNQLLTRAAAYNWLAVELGIEASQCHIAWLNKEQLQKVATLSAEYLKENFDALAKRKEKRNVKRRKRRLREQAEQQRNIAEARKQKTKRRY